MASPTVYERVARRLEIEIDDKLQGVIEEAIEDGWDLVRHYGRGDWTESSSPEQVQRIVAAAVKRYIDNPDGLEQSVAGDERLSWKDTPEPGSIFLTDSEKERLGRMANAYATGFGSVQVYAYGTVSDRTDVLAYDPRWVEPFPLFQKDEPTIVRSWP